MSLLLLLRSGAGGLWLTDTASAAADAVEGQFIQGSLLLGGDLARAAAVGVDGSAEVGWAVGVTGNVVAAVTRHHALGSAVSAPHATLAAVAARHGVAGDLAGHHGVAGDLAARHAVTATVGTGG